jgi:hypothetical protein
MDAHTTLADIMTICNVSTPDAAVGVVRRLIENAPVLGISAQGQLVAAPDLTIGVALQLLDAARNVVLAKRLT